MTTIRDLMDRKVEYVFRVAIKEGVIELRGEEVLFLFGNNPIRHRHVKFAAMISEHLKKAMNVSITDHYEEE